MCGKGVVGGIVGNGGKVDVSGVVGISGEVAVGGIRELQIHNEYDDKYEKVLRALQTNSVILCMLNGCSVLAARKSLQSVTNELDKLKL